MVESLVCLTHSAFKFLDPCIFWILRQSRCMYSKYSFCACCDAGVFHQLQFQSRYCHSAGLSSSSKLFLYVYFHLRKKCTQDLNIGTFAYAHLIHKSVPLQMEQTVEAGRIVQNSSKEEAVELARILPQFCINQEKPHPFKCTTGKSSSTWGVRCQFKCQCGELLLWEEKRGNPLGGPLSDEHGMCVAWRSSAFNLQLCQIPEN